MSKIQAKQVDGVAAVPADPNSIVYVDPTGTQSFGVAQIVPGVS